MWTGNIWEKIFTPGAESLSSRNGPILTSSLYTMKLNDGPIIIPSFKKWSF
jgi:hypothetical protein